MEEKLKNEVLEIQRGSYDLHIHSLPSVFARLLDGVQIVKEASQYGMAGVMLKSHYEPTALRAQLINKYSHCKTKAYGGLALNWPVGGLNPYAVSNALQAGAKIIWMPTRDSQNSLRFGNMDGDFFSRPGITILDEKGKLKDVVYDIFDLIKAKNGFLATGHLSPDESILLCREGRNRNVQMILTHPEFVRTKISGQVQKEMADLGVIIEKNWLNVAAGMVTPEEMSANIRAVGPSRVYIATDRGQKNAPAPAVEYGHFIAMLLNQGFAKEEVYAMTHTVPAQIVQ